MTSRRSVFCPAVGYRFRLVAGRGELSELRQRAIAHTLFAPTTLAEAIDRLGFVQADPIRAPARAQDLILRHRVSRYRVGDLERHYPSLPVEEDLLYAYGFLPRSVSQWLHPRGTSDLDELEQAVLAVIGENGPTHPADLAARLGHDRVVNAWGGYSKATKTALERLHFRGLLRVVRRDNGIRVYEVAPPRPEAARARPNEVAGTSRHEAGGASRRQAAGGSAAEAAGPDPHNHRLGRLLIVVTNVLAPVAEPTLRTVAAQLQRSLTGAPDHRVARQVLGALFEAGELLRETVDGAAYVSPVPAPEAAVPPARVRFLAPFDPLVWDRRRFEHLWGWLYRFEAYTPPALRVRGYYALPVLWRDQVIGWANAAVTDGRLQVELGYADRRPTGGAFTREAKAEAARLATFLGLPKGAADLDA